MKRIADILTAGITRASDILFVQNPKATSVGAFFGITLDGLLKLFRPTVGRFRDWVSLEESSVFYFIAMGIFFFNVPFLFRRRQLPNAVEDGFEILRRMKKDGASAVQIRMQYMALFQATLDRVKTEPGEFGQERLAKDFLRERF